MKVTHYTDVTLEDVLVEGAKGVKIRWLISEKDKAPNFALRIFEVAPGGFTPYHNHPFEHEVFIVEGEGVFVTEEKEYPFKTGYTVYVDPNMQHQFRNTGKGALKFLCIIPIEKPKKKEELPFKSINPFSTEKINNC